MKHKAEALSLASDYRMASFPSAGSVAEVARYWSASYRHVANEPDCPADVRVYLCELAKHEDATARQFERAYEADAIQLEAAV